MKKFLMTVILLSAVRTLAWPVDNGALAFQCASNKDARVVIQLRVNDDDALIHQPLDIPTRALHLKKTQENESLAVYSGFAGDNQTQDSQRMMTLDQSAFHPISNQTYEMHVMYLVGNNQSAQSIDDDYTCVAF